MARRPHPSATGTSPAAGPAPATAAGATGARSAAPRWCPARCGWRLVVRLRHVGVAGIARTDRVCFGPGAVRSPGVEASSGIDCRREPQRSAIVSQLASPTRCPVVFCPRHDLQPFPSLYRGRAEGRGLEPPRVHRVGTKPPGRWGNALRSTAPAPQSKPVTPASRRVAHVAPSVASGLGLRILAAGPARVRLYS
jgi:hypothetical protein